MNKSLLSKATSSKAVVTAADVGSFVKVAGVGPGILRYVGTIHGKDGLFCGIELDSTIGGKHNGTYQGVAYFKCPPERGIFAPMYKVELDEPDDVPMMSMSQHQQQVPERLSRSALPSLQLTNIFRPEHPCDPSSLISSFESSSINMDDSLFSQASWGDADMQASGATYIIPPGRGHYDQEEDLMNIKAPSDLVIIDEEELKRETQRILGESFVVEKSKIGVEHLPVVEDEDEDDLLTPIVELRRPIPPSSSAHQKLDIEVSNLPQSEPAASPQSSTALTTSRSSTSNSDCQEKPAKSPSSTSSKADSAKSQTEAKKGKASTMDKKGETATAPPKATKREAAPPPAAPAAPAAPKFPVKPKAPSKHQLMMEQLKASIEADKNKPKKEAKPRVSLAPPPPAPKQKENEPKAKMPAETQSTPRLVKQPLKASNTSLASTTSKPEPVKRERKPLYVPPPPKERKEKEEKPKTVAAKASTKTAAEPAKAAAVASVPTKASKQPLQYPTSSFAGGKLRTASTTSSGPSTSRNAASTKAKSLSEDEKLERLKQAVQAVEVLALVIQHMKLETDKLASNLESQTISSKELKNRLCAVEKLHSDDVERSRNHAEQVTRSHDETVARMKERFEVQLAEKAKEFDRTIEDEKSRQEAEVEAMSRRHQKVIGALDEKIAESEKIAVQLKADKVALQTALANDSDQRNQMLTKEINSLQTALELKSSEMKELRQKYQQIALRVEEIPLKDLEITKLKHKVAELKQSLDQKINYEKMLVHQNEELKRQQLMVEVEKDEMRKSIDVMVYKYENGEDTVNMDTSFIKYNTTPGRVNFRSRSSNSSHRPPSGIPVDARLSQSSCSDMERSTDRDSLTRSTVSMYASQYKLPENHAQDVIYAPDEMILGGSNVKLSNLLSEENDNTSKVNCNSTNPQTDSGIVC
ncbi:unnamed protein product [Auanema sp. JU1783]|nr:unnamed protein product [Auanema sp. JU1783]